MKIILSVLLSLLIILLLLSFLAFRYIGKITGASYKVRGEAVYYVGKMQGLGSRTLTKLEGVDVSTFRVLKNGYAKDKNKAYFLGELMVQSHGPSFKVLRHLFAKDNQQVFYRSVVVSQQTESFKILNPYYSKDFEFAYYKGTQIPDADSKTFQVHSRNKDEAKDKNGYFKSGSRTKKDLGW